MPSATAKSGGATRREPQLGIADLDNVAVTELAPPVQAPFVDERAVGRVQVDDPDAVPPCLDPGMVGRRELVIGERNGVVGGAADGQRDGAGLVFTARLEDARRHDHELPSAGRWGETCRGRLRRSHDEALLRNAEIAGGRPHDAPDEDVQQDEEQGLKSEEDGLDRHQPACSNVSSVFPMRMVSEWLRRARSTRRPFTSIPLVDFRSTIQKAPFSRRISACRRDALGSSSVMSQSRERPRTTLSSPRSCRVFPRRSEALASWARPSRSASPGVTASVAAGAGW
jgi:hypothetical protein